MIITIIIGVMFMFFLSIRHLFKPIRFFVIPHKILVTAPSYPVVFHTVWNFLKSTFKYTWIIGIFPLIFSFDMPSSASMTSSYRVSDVIFSSHCIYGISPENIGLESLRTLVRQYWQEPVLPLSTPQIGDVCVFRVDFSEMPFSKRIVAQGGDKIYINGNILIINGINCPMKFLRHEEIVENGKSIKYNIYERTLHNGFKHEVAFLDHKDLTKISNESYYTVPKDHYFMMGDNYYNSDDSRSYVGYVHRQRIFAKLQFIIMRNPNLRLMISSPLCLLKTKFLLIAS